METIVGKTFREQTVVMDDKTYVQCTFLQCEIVYTGGDFSWVSSRFDNCKVTITGNASRTMAFIQQIGILPKPDQATGSAAITPEIPDGGKFH